MDRKRLALRELLRGTDMHITSEVHAHLRLRQEHPSLISCALDFSDARGLCDIHVTSFYEGYLSGVIRLPARGLGEQMDLLRQLEMKLKECSNARHYTYDELFEYLTADWNEHSLPPQESACRVPEYSQYPMHDLAYAARNTPAFPPLDPPVLSEDRRTVRFPSRKT